MNARPSRMDFDRLWDQLDDNQRRELCREALAAAADHVDVERILLQHETSLGLHLVDLAHAAVHLTGAQLLRCLDCNARAETDPVLCDAPMREAPAGCPNHPAAA